MSETQVAVVWLHGPEVSSSFNSSLLNLAITDNRKHVQPDRWGAFSCATRWAVADTRNEAALWFLTFTEPDCRWLLFLDSDVGFPADLIETQLRAATAGGPQVIGGLYFIESSILPDGMGGHRTTPTPIIFDRVKDLYFPNLDYERNALVDCEGTGAGCLMIAREVLEAVGPNPFAHFGPLNEDLSFCRRAKDAGFAVRVNTAVKCSHHKSVWLTEADYEQIRAPLVEANRGGPIMHTELTPEPNRQQRRAAARSR